MFLGGGFDASSLSRWGGRGSSQGSFSGPGRGIQWIVDRGRGFLTPCEQVAWVESAAIQAVIRRWEALESIESQMQSRIQADCPLRESRGLVVMLCFP